MKEGRRDGGRSGHLRLLRALRGETVDRPPWWLMRQAGRYLPEYRALREQAPSFVAFCLSPQLASEATLQPIRRFGMDAAIVFADILLIAQALGQRLGFGETGPVLEPIGDCSGLSLHGLGALDPVYETVRLSRAGLPRDTALIGFAGAPWTVATYMAEGGTSRDFQKVKAWAYRDPQSFAGLIELLAEGTLSYLSRQIEAGADAVQLFDSWAGILPEEEFERWVVGPTCRIVMGLKERHPETPIIGFPRGAGLLSERYSSATGVDAVGLDTTLPLGFARDRLQSRVAVQGNLDPVLLAVGGEPLRRGVETILAALNDGRFVFNLGHGVLPSTPPEHVEVLARLLSPPRTA